MDLNLLIDDADMILIGLGSEFKKNVTLSLKVKKTGLLALIRLQKGLRVRIISLSHR